MKIANTIDNNGGGGGGGSNDLNDILQNTVGGSTSSLPDNSDAIYIDSPVSGTYANTTGWVFKIGGQSFVSILADGDGAGGITNEVIILHKDVTFYQLLGWNPVSVTAANDLPALTTNYVEIGGNTQINAIISTNLPPATLFTVKFLGTPTVKHNTAGGAGTSSILIDGNLDYTPTANSVVQLFWNGTNFYLSPFYTA